MADEENSGRTRSNPGAGQSERYGGGKPHRLGHGPRDGDAGGTRGVTGSRHGGRDRDEERERK